MLNNFLLNKVKEIKKMHDKIEENKICTISTHTDTQTHTCGHTNNINIIEILNSPQV